ncbi:hypothetical protein Glove_283g29 [Diversispora epigaea]|uniref:Uncharacterized protein n=1 Tax=Diversispora epigaea TaxID=1348612 RepID=A0A397I827_9GLOM|nr:hypothetical protein Glove_283g29 [Diversispora epigaea]
MEDYFLYPQKINENDEDLSLDYEDSENNENNENLSLDKYNENLILDENKNSGLNLSNPYHADNFGLGPTLYTWTQPHDLCAQTYEFTLALFSEYDYGAIFTFFMVQTSVIPDHAELNIPRDGISLPPPLPSASGSCITEGETEFCEPILHILPPTGTDPPDAFETEESLIKYLLFILTQGSSESPSLRKYIKIVLGNIMFN